jgi:hypothetical protein
VPIDRKNSRESNPQFIRTHSENIQRFERLKKLLLVLPKSAQNDENPVHFMKRVRQGQKRKSHYYDLRRGSKPLDFGDPEATIIGSATFVTEYPNIEYQYKT